MESPAKVEYNVRNLSTRSVTLFPTRAQVFRDIKDVPLKPGTNEITILGLSPTVDEDSIKVDGSGSAIISNIAVESLPNRDIFEEVYPDSDDDKLSDDESSEDEEIKLTEGMVLVAARSKKQGLDDEKKKATELIRSANSRLKTLEDYSNTLNGKNCSAINKTMEDYCQVRDAIFRDRIEGEKLERELEPRMRMACDELDRLERIHRRETAKANKERKRALIAKTKTKIKEARRAEERLAEKERIRKERQKFWPKYCYAVRITLEAGSFTPQTSRRNSMSSDIEVAAEEASLSQADNSNGTGTCDLVLSYVTSAASWSPSYDLKLSTTNANGTLCFDAQLSNTTSETWEKCRITLSTSQATSSSLGDTVPVLTPWRIKLDSYAPENSLVYSTEEKDHKSKLKNQQFHTGGGGKARSEMFGVDATALHKLDDYQVQLAILEQQNKDRMMMARQQQQQQQGGGLFGGASAAKVHKKKSGFESEARDGILARNRPMPAMQMAPQQMAPQQMAPQQMAPQQAPYMQSIWGAQQAPQQQPDFFGEEVAENKQGLFAVAESTADDDEQQLDFQESLVEETGFTTSYDLPGVKTLSPRSSSSKQRIARVNFANVVFSHTVVAKYRPAAYLNAKLTNASKLTLLRGPVGVTLDGSFAGRTTLPRCGAGGESVNLSLGVDSAVKVAYSPPEMKRATTGFFAKENIKLYTRVIHLENTRASSAKHTKLLVRDQIPVSGDEKLRVELLRPQGLVPDGKSQAAGEAGREKDRGAWGTAQASLHKDGEVNWLVALRPGKRVKLVMEYQVAMPAGDQAVQA